jgi:hypothetical protein
MIVHEADRTRVVEPIPSGSGIVRVTPYPLGEVGRVKVSLTWPVRHEQEARQLDRSSYSLSLGLGLTFPQPAWRAASSATTVLNRILPGTPDVAMAFGVPEPATSRRFAKPTSRPTGLSNEARR